MLETALNELKTSIIKILKIKPLNEWHNAKLVFEFPPYINKGHRGSQFFEDLAGNKVRNVIFLDDEGLHIFFNLIFIYNQNKTYNTIIFETKYNDYENATISISFNQEVEDNFQNNLPKSKRGKTLPWWKIESETIGLGE